MRASNLFAPSPGMVAIATPATLGLLGGNLATVKWSAILSQGSLSLTGVGGNSALGSIDALTQEAAGNILDLLYFDLRSLCCSEDGRKLLALKGGVERVETRVIRVESANQWHQMMI